MLGRGRGPSRGDGASDHYIFEYVPNKYSVSDATFGRCSAVEIKIGQGTKPGMGGHLPGARSRLR
nr:glutamate synthase-related protein [Candidatus Methanomethylophilus sp. 1R26]